MARASTHRKECVSVCAKSQETLTLTSSEKRFEVGNNVADKIKRTLERFENRLSLRDLRLSERYLKSELQILVQFKVFKEYVASFQRTNLLLGGNELISCVSEASEQRNASPPIPQSVNRNHRCADSSKCAVLVDVIQFAEPPNRVIPTLVRFDRIDRFYRIFAHQLYFSMLTGFVFLGGAGNRESNRAELSTAIGTFTGGENELIGQVIESGPERLQNVTTDQRNICANVGDVDDDVLPELRKLRMTLGANFIWLGFDEAPNSGFQVMDMFFGPFDFMADALNSLHGPR